MFGLLCTKTLSSAILLPHFWKAVIKIWAMSTLANQIHAHVVSCMIVHCRACIMWAVFVLLWWIRPNPRPVRFDAVETWPEQVITIPVTISGGAGGPPSLCSAKFTLSYGRICWFPKPNLSNASSHCTGRNTMWGQCGFLCWRSIIQYMSLRTVVGHNVITGDPIFNLGAN